MVAKFKFILINSDDFKNDLLSTKMKLFWQWNNLAMLNSVEYPLRAQLLIKLKFHLFLFLIKVS